MPLPITLCLETDRLRLRMISLKDIPYVFSASQHPGFTDGMLWEPPARIEELEAPHLRGLESWKKGEGYGFTIESKDKGVFLGRISIRPTSETDVWNIGFWTHPDHQGQGIMKEAVAAVLALGFTELNARRIEACHALWNKASEKVLQHNGFQFVRYIREGFKKHGAWIDENLLAVDRNAWQLKKKS